jgi:D-arabinose 1-dehydrogenase-like Zn-dependent alcohol dehydrogenase
MGNAVCVTTSHINRTTLDKINNVFADLKRGTVDGRMVLDIGRA